MWMTEKSTWRSRSLRGPWVSSTPNGPLPRLSSIWKSSLRVSTAMRPVAFVRVPMGTCRLIGGGTLIAPRGQENPHRDGVQRRQ